MASNIAELPVEQLRRVCDPAQFAFQSTEELPALEGIIGQERAMRAISFGIDIQDHGYHVFALGPAGTGKTTIIEKFLDREARARPAPNDWVYTNNFADADKPRAMCLPAGTGCHLQTDMERLVEDLKREVPRVFESAEYSRQQEQLEGELQKVNQELLEQAGKFATEKGFALVQTPQGMMIAPAARNGSVLSPEQVDQLDEATRKRLEEGQHEVESKMRETMRGLQQSGREARDRTTALDRDTVAFAVGHLLDELRERYLAFPPVVKLLDEIRNDILENAQAFKQLRQAEQLQSEQNPLAALLGGQAPTFDQYRVNLIINNCETKGAPVVQARNPSYHNLVGRIEHQGQFGTLVTNFRMIKGGLLHKANGGYLVLDIRDVLTKPLAWEGLKRALKTSMIEIESLAEAYGLFATRTLEPEPIPLNVKVVLIGDPYVYYLLFYLDPDFQELFKVKADFSVRMDRTPESTEQYARFIATVCREENLWHFDPSGVARVVEQGARLVEHQGKLVTKFGVIVDLLRQASFWAGRNGHALVSADDVKQAIAEKTYRSNQIQQQLEEAIIEGTLLIDTGGQVPGQINGMAVLGLGDYAFGKPSRITARVSVGDEGVISIDREVKMGGRIHNKGAYILAGYLRGNYASEAPLAVSASLTFEQEYEEIEGDSASSTELYALLSALADLPLRQDIAVTGSVNQRGQVQAIGGVNEKIEGFFDVCRRAGLTGSQGVMIPLSNVKHLMLREDVVQAAREGKFHIYPVSTIDEGISLLTGRDAGERQADGSYPDNTVNALVHKRLRELAQKVRLFLHEEKRRGEDEEGRKAA